MNGVEILSSQAIYDTILPGWVGAISFGILMASAILCAVFAAKFKTAGVIICFILVVVSIVSFGLSLTSDETDINHNEYKVTIDDSVSMNEFLDKYEILDQEGKIYTIKEKTNEDK